MAEISSTGDQMLAVLEMVAREGPLSAAQAARLCGLNRTVAHRLLVTLSRRSFVRRAEEGYVLGPALVRLGSMAQVGFEAVVKPFMVELAQEIGEAVVLHVLDHFEAVVAEQALGQQHVVRVEHAPGSRHPLCKGASGWAILAHLPEKTIERVLKGAGAEKAGRARIELVRSAGYAITHDELQLGVHGLAAPLFRDGACMASLAILVPSGRADTLLGYRERLMEVASKASEAMTASGSQPD